MKRATHLLLGAAAAMPVALTLSPGLALGSLWWGMVGGGFPDWFDLRSEFRKGLRLRHRGASHGLPFVVAMTGGLYLLLGVLAATPLTWGDVSVALTEEAIRPWTAAFALGILSHLLSDAWTHAGIRPLSAVLGCPLLDRAETAARQVQRPAGRARPLRGDARAVGRSHRLPVDARQPDHSPVPCIS